MRGKICIVGSVGLLIAGIAGAAVAAETAANESSPMASSMHVVANLNDVKWGPQSDALPPGGNLTVLAGNPSSSGFISLRAKFPAGYTVPPHFHSTDVHVTVLSGSMAYGIGDKVDPKTQRTVSRGGYLVEPAQMHHYVIVKAPSIIQFDLDGPFDITYVNPADDPRNKKAQK